MDHIQELRALPARFVCFAAVRVTTVLLAVFVDKRATGYAAAGQATANAQSVVIARG